MFSFFTGSRDPQTDAKASSPARPALPASTPVPSASPSSPPTSPAPPAASEKPAFDPDWYTTSRFFSILTGQATNQETAEYIEARSIANEEKQCGRCEEWRDWILAQSPTAIFLRQKINQLGADINSSNVHCRRCPSLEGRKFGAFDGQYGVLLCANHLRDRSHTEDVLAHEMVHAWDYLRFDWDKKDLRHAACAEIRATMLSGECRWAREFFDNHQIKFTGHFQDCVRKRATLSVTKHPFCKDEDEAKTVVQAVWGSCFADTRPFDEIYR